MRRLITIILLLPFFLSAQTKITDVSSIDDSEIIIFGTSNVTDYTCELYDLSNNQFISITSQRVGNKVFLNNAVIQLSAKGFKCDNSLMNTDFYKAIKADSFPYITIQFNEFTLNQLISEAPLQNDVPSSISITLAGVTKTYSHTLASLEVQQDRIILSGTMDLLMSEFGITPPTAMFGMVKAGNEIKIAFQISFVFS